jgi:hypothetical protein
VDKFNRAVISRREFVWGAAALSGAVLLPAGVAWSSDAKFGVSKDAKAAIETSKLIYITPIKSNGEESSCHAEVWFHADGADLLVVTKP